MNAITTKLAAAGIKVYKVRAIVIERKRGGKFEDAYRKEIIIIDHADRAKDIYREQLNQVECYTQYSKYHGICELFEPKILENGELAYFPTDEKTYLERYNKPE